MKAGATPDMPTKSTSTKTRAEVKPEGAAKAKEDAKPAAGEAPKK
jgi:hypothetical protein